MPRESIPRSLLRGIDLHIYWRSWGVNCNIIYTEYPVWIEWVDLYRISRGSCLPVNEKFYQALAFQEQNELTEEMKEKLIDKVLVYPDNKIEIHLGKRAIITGN